MIKQGQAINLSIFLQVIMGKCKRTVLKLLIVLITLFFINGERSLLKFNSNQQILLTHVLVNDVETTHQQNLVICTDDDNWPGSFKSGYSYFHRNSVRFFCILNSSPKEFFGSIWQPPEIV